MSGETYICHSYSSSCGVANYSWTLPSSFFKLRKWELFLNNQVEMPEETLFYGFNILYGRAYSFSRTTKLEVLDTILYTRTLILTFFIKFLFFFLKRFVPSLHCFIHCIVCFYGYTCNKVDRVFFCCCVAVVWEVYFFSQ